MVLTSIEQLQAMQRMRHLALEPVIHVLSHILKLRSKGFLMQALCPAFDQYRQEIQLRRSVLSHHACCKLGEDTAVYKQNRELSRRTECGIRRQLGSTPPIDF